MFRGSFMKTFMTNTQPNFTATYYTYNSIINPSYTKTPSSALNYSMIGRIYTAKPGCGSCGK